MKRAICCLLTLALLMCSFTSALAENKNIFSVDANITIRDQTFNVQFSISEVVDEEPIIEVDDEEPIAYAGYTTVFDEASLVRIDEDLSVISNEILVKVKSNVTREEVAALARSLRGEVVGEVPLLNVYQLRFTEVQDINTLDVWRTTLESSALVEKTYNNLVMDVSASAIPNDPECGSWNVENPSGNNWWLECIDAPTAWDSVDEMQVVKVGIIDSPVYYMHEDLEINPSRISFRATDDFGDIDALWQYYARSESSHVCIDLEHCTYCSMKDHGTHVAGIIGATANNRKGISGTSWRTELYCAPGWFYTRDQSGNDLNASSTTISYALAITELVMSGCKVINMSIRSKVATDPNSISTQERLETEFIDDIILELEDMGYDFLIVKAAGNSGINANQDRLNRILTNGANTRAHTIIVGAVENAQSLTNWLTDLAYDGGRVYNMAFYSNDGGLLDICAPGTDIYSTISNDRYANMSGTSMAAPIVTAAASMVYALIPNAPYGYAKTIVCNTSHDYCARNGSVYRILNVGNLVETVQAQGLNFEPQPEPAFGFVKGVVNDASTLNPIANAVVRMDCLNNPANSVFATFMDGNYEFAVPSGTYNLTFEAPGYISETLYNVEVETGVIQYNVQLRMASVGIAEDGQVSGQVINAQTGRPISNAMVTIYRGIYADASVVRVAAQVFCDNNGRYNVSLPTGNYTAIASAEGYSSGMSVLLSMGGELRGDQNITITPLLVSNELRIVLTWGQYPADLDSHTISREGGNMSHVYWSDKDAYIDGELSMNLDVDDTTSYGPETTTIFLDSDARYSYYVHDYTNRNSPSSTQLGSSEARVTVYVDNSTEPRVFEVPVMAGTLWHVFDFVNGQIVPVNAMSYYESPSSVGE